CLLRGERPAPLEHPRQLLELLGPTAAGLDPDAEARFRRFAVELDNSTANYALALAGAERRRAELADAARLAGVATTLEWVDRQRQSDSTFSPLVFYEQWVVDGHPLHPGAKIKLGMGPADVMRYSPEWGACPGVRLVAVARHACRVVGATRSADLLARQYPDLGDQVRAELTRRGHDPERFDWVPAHPWQVDHTLPRLHADAIERGEVVPLEGPTIAAAALMSVRTLAPRQCWGEGKHHMKTALAVQTTGAVRTVSPNAAENGPALSRALEEVRRREQGFAGRFVVLAEPMAVYYQPSAAELSQEQRAEQSKHLAAVFRVNPEDFVGPGEVALPASALVAGAPLGQGPILGDFLERMGRGGGLVGRRDAAGTFLRRYVEVALPPLLTLMVRYGIGLEGHLQNSIVVFRDGQPVRLLVRDFGGVRILLGRLRRQGINLSLLPGSATIAADVDDLRNKVYYAVFQNHLGELIACLAGYGGVEEGDLWYDVARQCQATFQRLRADPDIAAEAAADEEALFQPFLALKAMTTMRLLGEVTRYAFAPVPNPLVSFTRTA
ncbi:MAG: hypothetical protein NZ700_05950, partial [Gemmataceae bacterium]|nr:hypothetical protein [Gemmataceae bacterium]